MGPHVQGGEVSLTAVRLPLCPFPPIPWWRVARAAEASIDVAEHYPKRTFRNRILLMTSNGIQSLSLPVERRGGVPRVQDATVRIKGDADRKTWQAVRSAYGRAPFFPEMAGELEALFLSGPGSLGGFNRASLAWSAQWLGMDVPGDALESHGERGLQAYPPFAEDAQELEEVKGWAHVWDGRGHVIPYAQLSILDVLMHLGPEAAHRIIPQRPNGSLHPG